MHDADLGDMLDSAFAAAYDHARGFDHGDPLNCDACAEKRAEIVAHVREREVELMALAMFRLRNHGVPSPEKWSYIETARNWRDAFDQTGEGA